MGYVVYDRSIYRTGFRPMGETDPFAAVQLGSTPFRPEHLRGMGQIPPFTDAGGYALHGLGDMGDLGDMVPDQAMLTYAGTWTNPPYAGISQALRTPGQILDQVVAALNQDGLAVRSSSTAGGWVTNDFTVKLQLQVDNGQGFGDPNDVIAIIRHEVYVATGAFPTADAIPTVQAPGSAAPVATGQGAGPAAPVDPLTWFEDNAVWIGLGAAALVVLPMVLGRR